MLANVYRSKATFIAFYSCEAYIGDINDVLIGWISGMSQAAGPSSVSQKVTCSIYVTEKTNVMNISKVRSAAEPSAF